MSREERYISRESMTPDGGHLGGPLTDDQIRALSYYQQIIENRDLVAFTAYTDGYHPYPTMEYFRQDVASLQRLVLSHIDERLATAAAAAAAAALAASSAAPPTAVVDDVVEGNAPATKTTRVDHGSSIHTSSAQPFSSVRSSTASVAEKVRPTLSRSTNTPARARSASFRSRFADGYCPRVPSPLAMTPATAATVGDAHFDATPIVAGPAEPQHNTDRDGDIIEMDRPWE